MKRALSLLLMSLAGLASAHPAPSSILRLEFRRADVHAEYWVPESELEYARVADPAGDYPGYLLRHLGAETATGTRWRVVVESVRETTYLGHPYRIADLSLTPPPGMPALGFVLVDDAVTHEVRNHVVYVVVRRGDQPALVGALQYPARRLDIAAR